MQEAIKMIHGGRAPLVAHDFSVPVNPLGPPPWLGDVVSECLARHVHLRYPSPGYEELREAISVFHEADPGGVVVVNGAAEALSVLPLILRARRVVVVEPCFGDHAVQARSVGIELRRLVTGLRAERVVLPSVSQLVDAAGRGAVVLLSRPNNPVGYVAPRDYVYEAAEVLHRRGSWLVVDEAFIDLAPGVEPLEPMDGLVIVRSFTKTFATPGLRLGYVYAEEQVARRIRLALQAWPVGGLEECAYSALLTDPRSRDYVARARLLVEEEAPRLRKSLGSLGLLVYPSRAPFLLVRHDGAPHPVLQEALVRRGVYVRDASSFYGLDEEFSRVSVRSPGENNVLIEAFAKAMGEELG